MANLVSPLYSFYGSRRLILTGTVEFMPIHFMHKSVNFDELIALYAVSDVCLVSSTRDGMNLVSFEYIATQRKRHGVMILSEFAGAAQSLNGSLIVNPWNTEELAGAIHEAVTMGDEQRQINFEKLDKYVQKYTRWDFLHVECSRLHSDFCPKCFLGPILCCRTDTDLRKHGEESQKPEGIRYQRRRYNIPSY